MAAEPELAFPTITSSVADSLRLPYVALYVVGDTGRERLVAEHGEARGQTVDLPLTHGAARVGRLVLGVRPGERDFRADERGLLEDLARQAGAAVHAIALRADLARSREQLVLAREEERRRLRRDLHDGLGPTLAAIGLRAEASAETIPTDPDGARRMLDELSDDVRVALADIRRLVDGLRPPALDELGLIGAIEQQASRLGANGTDAGDGRGLPITVLGLPSPLPELAAAVEVAAYRIAVEALTNAVRHAGAARCDIRVDATAGDTLQVDVVDNGRGVAPDAAPGVGLESIRARADELGGSVEVAPEPEGGTRVTARLPLQRVRA
jgi:signal transduction histidine kinase